MALVCKPKTIKSSEKFGMFCIRRGGICLIYIPTYKYNKKIKTVMKYIHKQILIIIVSIKTMNGLMFKNRHMNHVVIVKVRYKSVKREKWSKLKV